MIEIKRIWRSTGYRLPLPPNRYLHDIAHNSKIICRRYGLTIPPNGCVIYDYGIDEYHSFLIIFNRPLTEIVARFDNNESFPQMIKQYSVISLKNNAIACENTWGSVAIPWHVGEPAAITSNFIPSIYLSIGTHRYFRHPKYTFDNHHPEAQPRVELR